ncbi:hypothetical protein EUX98_g1994 [Antrodiella citrinella]|uniref:Prolyl 4-hydroxylase alpha subunit Fe(2+) 2OG dioxygenase domain-containing protein n=1 Tax=Antrodiella citrinella TaxID=2447956 RepID=A0A4S4N2E9_9APHY|nr:hypothetical protein EUX98_g1994 [Antrodiella citrinella]
MSMSAAQLKSLQEAVTSSKLPYCSGTLSASPGDLNLYYKNEQIARCLHFPTATEDDLEHLSHTCEPATFGRNGEDVLDDSYRKAGKLDAANFTSSFDLQASGLLTLLKLDGQGDSIVRAERYKVNVYGKDAFFKAHKDTPRGEDMFGSLVLVFHTQHTGGALLLRDKHKKWTVDSAKAIQDHAGGPCIAFVAFYSDVEHEVAKIESGYRVTLTYNSCPCIDPSSFVVARPNVAVTRALRQTSRYQVFPSQGRSAYMAYGNEAEMAWEYANLCMVVQVGLYGDRKTL